MGGERADEGIKEKCCGTAMSPANPVKWLWPWRAHVCRSISCTTLSTASFPYGVSRPPSPLAPPRAVLHLISTAIPPTLPCPLDPFPALSPTLILYFYHIPTRSYSCSCSSHSRARMRALAGTVVISRTGDALCCHSTITCWEFQTFYQITNSETSTTLFDKRTFEVDVIIYELAL